MQIFHLYKGFKRKVSSKGFFVKGSAKIVTPPRTEYRGFKFKYNSKGDICRAALVRLKKGFSDLDGSTKFFHQNTGVLIKKKTKFKVKIFARTNRKVCKKEKV